MILTVRRPMTKERRECWKFSLAPADADSDDLTLILAEYAIEMQGKTGWVRPSATYYKRRAAPEARMTLKAVPAVNDTVKQLLKEQLWRQVRLVGQSDTGVVTF